MEVAAAEGLPDEAKKITSYEDGLADKMVEFVRVQLEKGYRRRRLLPELYEIKLFKHVFLVETDYSKIGGMA